MDQTIRQHKNCYQDNDGSNPRTIPFSIRILVPPNIPHYKNPTPKNPDDPTNPENGNVVDNGNQGENNGNKVDDGIKIIDFNGNFKISTVAPNVIKTTPNFFEECLLNELNQLFSSLP